MSNVGSFIDSINQLEAKSKKLPPKLRPLYVLLWDEQKDEVVMSNDPEAIMAFVMMRNKAKTKNLVDGLYRFADNIKFTFEQNFGEGSLNDEKK